MIPFKDKLWHNHKVRVNKIQNDVDLHGNIFNNKNLIGKDNDAIF